MGGFVGAASLTSPMCSRRCRLEGGKEWEEEESEEVVVG